MKKSYVWLLTAVLTALLTVGSAAPVPAYAASKTSDTAAAPTSSKKTAKKKPQKPNKVGNFLRLAIFWCVALLFIFALFGNPFAGNVLEEEKSLTEVLALAKDSKLENITVRGSELHVKPRDDSGLKPIVSRKEAGSSLQEQGFAEVVEQGKVSIKVEEATDI